MGESTVGKTAICHQLSSDGTDFPKNYITTSLCDVLVKAVKIPDTNDLGAKYLAFFSSRSLKTREKCISFAQLVLLSLYIFLREVCLLFNV